MSRSKSGNNEDISDEQEQLAARLKESREYLGMSQEFVAQHLGIARAAVSAIETGRRKVGSLELREFARLYKCTVDYLLGGEPQQDSAVEESVQALFRTAQSLTEKDRQEVLRFAQFLGSVGNRRNQPPSGDDDHEAE